MKLIIYGEPAAKQRPRLGKGYTYTPTKTVNYETLVRQIYIQHYPGKQLDGELIMHIRAYFGIPKSASRIKREQMLSGRIRPTKRPDWDNVGKIVSDALNGLAYHDDSQIVTATVEKWYGERPRVEIEIEEAGQ